MTLPFGYSLNADFQGEFLLFISLLLVMILFVILTNRRSHSAQGQLGRGQLGLMLFLRITALLILLLLMFDPYLSLDRVRSIPQKIAVIIDQSSSMAKAWQGSSQELQVSIENTIDDLNQKYAVHIWSMDGETLESGLQNFSEDMSIFSWTPSLGAPDDQTEVYAAALVISDGQLNGGRSPLDLPWSRNLPIYPLFPLKPHSNAQMKILELVYEAGVNPEDGAALQVKIQQYGLVGETLDVTITNTVGQILGDKSYRLEHIFSEVNLRIPALGDGSHKLNVTIALENGDLRSEKQLEIELEKPRKQVLLLTERVNELHKLLLLHLPDSLFQIHSVIGTASEQKISSRIAEIPSDLDLIILNQPGGRVFSDRIKAIISSELKSACPVIVFQDGSHLMDSRWLELLSLREMPHNDSGELTVRWSSSAKDHPLYLGLLGLGFSPADMLKYPPVYRGSTELLHSGIELLVAGIGEHETASLVLGDNPPMAIFSGAGYWKWFFHPQSKLSFKPMWEYLLIYLDGIADFKPVSLNLPVSSAVTGAFVGLDISVKDLDNRSINTAELRVWQEDVAGNQTVLDLTRNNSGKYTTSLITKQAGETLVIAEAYRFGELWGRDTSRIQLMAFSGENQSEGVDQVFLARLARRSGAKIIHYGEDELPEIPVANYSQRSSIHLKGVRSSGLFVVLLTLLVMEWILRRRNGLL